MISYGFFGCRTQYSQAIHLAYFLIDSQLTNYSNAIIIDQHKTNVTFILVSGEQDFFLFFISNFIKVSIIISYLLCVVFPLLYLERKNRKKFH